MTAPPDDDRIAMTCCDCGREFLALGEWQVRCRTCYRAFKEGGDRAAEIAALQAENEQLRADLEAVQRERDRLWADVLRAKLQAAPAGRPAIPREQWRRLVQLCHPDKHGKSGQDRHRELSG
jgi:hypothetical protein